MPSGPSTKKAHRQRHLQTKLGNVLAQFGKGGRGRGQRKKQERKTDKFTV